MSYGTVEPGTLDVLIMDEAHRIREKTGYPFKATGRPQVEDLIHACKVSLFFVDDFQAVRKGEIGSSKLIRKHAERLESKVFEYELEAQFRCGDSDGFTNWIDNTLQIRRTANPLWKDEPNFEFKIYPSPEELDKEIRSRAEEGYSSRMVAGFCWSWSNRLGDDGQLIKNVKIGTFEPPWNARPELKGLSRNIPKSHYWAYDERGIDQVGCVYTAPAFEFDYVGVIFGNDIRYNPKTSEWEGFPDQSHHTQVKSADNFLELMKNTYRVLLTRGMKGCYVHFMDNNTEMFFRSRLEKYHCFPKECATSI